MTDGAEGSDPGTTGLHERVLDRMIDGVFALDPDWEFTYLNERGREIVCEAAGESYTAADLVGRNIWELLPEARGTTFEERYREAVRTGEEVAFDEYYAPIGVWFDIRAYPSETGLTVCFRDITKQRRRREQLESREAVLREMYDAIADRESSFEERVDTLLRIGQRVFGTPYGALSRVRGEEYVFEVVRSPDGELQAGDAVDLSATNCERVVLDAETLVLANVATDAPDLTDRDGFAEWGISCYVGTPVVVDSGVYGTFCFYDTDPREEPFSEWEVTLVDLMGRWVSVALDRQLAEDRLRRQNDRLERFASLVSHDLRNPLNVADGWLDLAREESESEALAKVAASHDRMGSIIDDALSLARAGHDVDDPEPIDLSDVATDAWAQVRTADATLSVEDGLAVRGDPTRVQQLFENLFRNSVEHGSTTPRSNARGNSVEHGSPDSRTKSGDAVEHGPTNGRSAADDGTDRSTLTVTVGSLPDGFYVADDGVGIPESERDRVFEFGYTTSEDGTGIGLGIVRDIATAHGWTQSVTESADGGARFEFAART